MIAWLSFELWGMTSPHADLLATGAFTIMVITCALLLSEED